MDERIPEARRTVGTMVVNIPIVRMSRMRCSGDLTMPSLSRMLLVWESASGRSAMTSDGSRLHQL